MRVVTLATRLLVNACSLGPGSTSRALVSTKDSVLRGHLDVLRRFSKGVAAENFLTESRCQLMQCDSAQRS